MKLKEVVLLQATKDFLVKSSLVSNPVAKDKQETVDIHQNKRGNSSVKNSIN